jgi:hypothetical protein
VAQIWQKQLTVAQRVAVVGWQWYESICEIKAVRMVVESAW